MLHPKQRTVFDWPEKPLSRCSFCKYEWRSGQEYFSEPSPKNIITRCPVLPSFVMRAFKLLIPRKIMDIRRVSKELGVRLYPEGSVRKSGNRLRVTAQLIDGITGNHVSLRNMDGDLKGHFSNFRTNHSTGRHVDPLANPV